jgi:hypothetical protein
MTMQFCRMLEEIYMEAMENSKISAKDILTRVYELDKLFKKLVVDELGNRSLAYYIYTRYARQFAYPMMEDDSELLSEILSGVDMNSCTPWFQETFDRLKNAD